MKQDEPAQDVKERLLNGFVSEHGAGAAFSALADTCADAAVFAVDANRTVVFWSRGAERLLGFRAAEVLGEHCLKSNRCPQCIKGCGVAEHGRITGVELDLFRDDGSSVRVKKYARSFTSAAGAFTGAIEVLLPVSAETAKKKEGGGGRGRLTILPSLDADVVRFHGIVSREPNMKDIFDVVRNVSRTDVTVLLRGDSGSGKELFARAIHAESHRKEGPFLAVNCAAMSPGVLESELFGHERGAFTGAVQTHQGLFERAEGGTLFLDEVAELPLELQAKLLRVIEDRTFFRVGGTKSMRVDARFISATHRSLKKEVAAGRFREDLMYRLRVVPLFLPALKERRADIPLVAEQFVRALNEKGPRVVDSIAPDAMRRLLEYDWPGNVRELRNAIEYAFAVGQSRVLALAELPPEVRNPQLAPPPPPAHASRREEASSSASSAAGHARRSARRGVSVDEETERTAIERALRQANGNVGDAAASLGMSRPTFWRKRRQHGL